MASLWFYCSQSHNMKLFSNEQISFSLCNSKRKQASSLAAKKLDNQKNQTGFFK